MTLLKLDRSAIETGGFHGIEQKRLIVNPVYGPQMGVKEGTWDGLGNLVYFADSWFKQSVATGLHLHQFIDVLTFVVEGKLGHEGSLEHGKSLKTLDFQVQKSGEQGFMHNEVNNGEETTRMLQLWLIPEQQEASASFRVHQATKGKITKIYGTQDGNTTQIEVGNLAKGQTFQALRKSLVYVVKGSCIINSKKINEGNLVAITDEVIESNEDDSLFIIAYSFRE